MFALTVMPLHTVDTLLATALLKVRIQMAAPAEPYAVDTPLSGHVAPTMLSLHRVDTLLAHFLAQRKLKVRKYMATPTEPEPEYIYLVGHYRHRRRCLRDAKDLADEAVDENDNVVFDDLVLGA
jgi:hypothetical protein